nr:RHS repeat-associated core domain-containing protein [Mangrovivirga halotolerans]
MELDEETGLYYYGARYYDAKISNFISTDPIIKPHESVYASFSNNPIRFIDPDGRDTVDINKNSEGIWEISKVQLAKGDDIFRVNDGENTKTYTFSEGEYGERVNMLNLENTDKYTLGVYHISGVKFKEGRVGYFVTPGGSASTKVGSNKRLPADIYQLQESPAGTQWQQVWVTNGNANGDVSARGIKIHFAGNTPSNWTQGCFVISSSYTKKGGNIRYDFEQSRVALMLLDFHLGANSIYIYAS